MYIQNNTDNTEKIPTTLNYLRPASFRFQITALPRITFTCQKANIPTVTIGTATQVTPVLDIPVFGDKLEFGDLQITFMVAEDMSNYKEIYNWIIKIAGSQISKYADEEFVRNLGRFPVTGSTAETQATYSDATMHIVDGSNNIISKINYLDVVPVSLQALDFDITNTSQEPLLATAIFKYRMYELETL
jgi:hypothetical protein